MKDSNDKKQISKKDSKKNKQSIKTDIRAGNDLLSDFDPTAVGSAQKGSVHANIGYVQTVA